jgi:hypothetical protein
MPSLVNVGTHPLQTTPVRTTLRITNSPGSMVYVWLLVMSVKYVFDSLIIYVGLTITLPVCCCTSWSRLHDWRANDGSGESGGHTNWCLSAPGRFRQIPHWMGGTSVSREESFTVSVPTTIWHFGRQPNYNDNVSIFFWAATTWLAHFQTDWNHHLWTTLRTIWPGLAVGRP